MDKRTFLAVGLSILILVVYQYFFPSVPPKAPQVKADQEATGAEVATLGSEATTSVPALVPEAASVAPIAGGQAEFLQTYQTQQEGKIVRPITVETNLYTLTINNKGAVITSLLLNNYHTKEGGRVELVANESVEQNFYPLSLVFDSAELTQRSNNVFYEASVYSLSLDERNPEGKLELSYTDPAGIKITKELHFSNDNYHVTVVVKRQNLGASPVLGRYYLTWGYNLGREKVDSKYHYTGPISYIDDELVEDEADDIEGTVFHKGNISWTALQDVYFASILIPHSVTSEVKISKDNEKLLSIGVSSSASQINPGETIKDSFGLYAGPKKMEPLQVLNMNLDKLIDYGWFDILAKPLMRGLNFSNLYTNNYGVDIIILTILIKLLFFPLTTASFKSMRSMQKLQPKMAALRKKYKKDPQTLNKEIMDLYKKHKVNPLGGCMPMLLQIPVFFALYKALLMSIELRHAPFMLWITDLSVKDPYYITPLLMGLSMFVQQKMTPTGGDPKQAKLMLLMPVVMTVMFLNFPSGLVIYWLLNNVLGIGQQHWINTQDKAKEAV